jgi:predicted peptidase
MSWWQFVKQSVLRLKAIVASTLLLTPAATNGWAQEVPAWHELFAKHQFTGEQDQVLNYRLLKPDVTSKTKVPLVIFLHGAGERGDNNVAQLIHGLKEFAKPENRQQYPCWVIAPQCPANQKWTDLPWNAKEIQLPESPSTSMKLLMQVVDKLLAENPTIDPQRVYITGLSMGGFGTIDAVARWPQRFAAAAPVCGGGDTRPEVIKNMTGLPWWVAHGKDDNVVPFELSQKLVAALRENGAQVNFVEMENVGHDSWTKTYSDPEFMKWLFAQKRQ